MLSQSFLFQLSTFVSIDLESSFNTLARCSAHRQPGTNALTHGDIPDYAAADVDLPI